MEALGAIDRSTVCRWKGSRVEERLEGRRAAGDAGDCQAAEGFARRGQFTEDGASSTRQTVFRSSSRSEGGKYSSALHSPAL